MKGNKINYAVLVVSFVLPPAGLALYFYYRKRGDEGNAVIASGSAIVGSIRWVYILINILDRYMPY